MADQQGGSEARPPSESPIIPLWPWCVARIKRKLHERRIEREKENPQDRFARRTANATVWIAILAIVAAGVGTLQYCTMQGQLNEARNQRLLTIAQLRPTISYNGISVQPFTGDGKIADKGDQILGWNINPKLKNTGGSDARNYISWFDISVTPVTQNTCPSVPIPDPLPTPIIIPREGNVTESAKALLLQDAVQASAKAKRIFISGHAEYDDIFPESHRHHFDWCVLAIPNEISYSLFSFPRLRETGD